MIVKIFKAVGVLLLALVLGLVITVAIMLNYKYESTPYPIIHASTDSAVIARGKYLVHGPAHCSECHSPEGTDAALDRGEQVALSGGRVFELPVAKIYAPNITPDKTGISKISDEQIARALRYGVGFDEKALIDFMPFHNTSDEDLRAIISYLRVTFAVENKVPKDSYTTLGMVLKALVIKPVGPTGAVPKFVKPDSTAEYGKYLATSIANCRGCHTERNLKTGAFIGPEYGGGFEIQSTIDEQYIFHTPNISPDKETGHIYGWSEERFVNRFKQGKLIPQSPMPWGPFSRMKELEIKAIYRYLQTITPINRKIEKIVEVKKLIG